MQQAPPDVIRVFATALSRRTLHAYFSLNNKIHSALTHINADTLWWQYVHYHLTTHPERIEAMKLNRISPSMALARTTARNRKRRSLMWKMVLAYGLECQVRYKLRAYTVDFILECYERGWIDILRILKGRLLGDYISHQTFDDICQRMKFVTHQVGDWDYRRRLCITGVNEGGIRRNLNDVEVLVVKLLNLRSY